MDRPATAMVATANLMVRPVWAAGSNMPWEQPLNQILQSVEGPVAKIIAEIIIIVTGLPADPDRIWSFDRVRCLQLLTPYQRAAQGWDDRIGSARVQAKNSACVARREWLALHRPCRHGLHPRRS
jgi:hypothetical protein